MFYHFRVGVLEFPSGRVYRRNTSLSWTGVQGLDNTSSKPYLRNSDIMGVLEYPLETINITESSTSLSRAATSLPPVPPGIVKSSSTMSKWRPESFAF